MQRELFETGIKSISRSRFKTKRTILCKHCGKKVDPGKDSIGSREHRCSGCQRKYSALVGRRSGRLAALAVYSKAVGTKRIHYVVCRCACGKERTLRMSNFSSGKTRSCGCLNEDAIARKRLTPALAGMRQTINGYKKAAQKRGYAWQLSEAECESLFSGQCHYCGSAPGNYKKTRWHSGGFTYNGIDRKNNSLGYVPGNVVSCCSRCNRAKDTMSYSEFIQWIGKCSLHLFRHALTRDGGMQCA